MFYLSYLKYKKDYIYIKLERVWISFADIIGNGLKAFANGINDIKCNLWYLS